MFKFTNLCRKINQLLLYITSRNEPDFINELNRKLSKASNSSGSGIQTSEIDLKPGEQQDARKRRISKGRKISKAKD